MGKWYDDPELRRGARALCRAAFGRRFGGAPRSDPLGDYIEKKREQKNTKWEVSWGKSVSYFDSDQEKDMKQHINQLRAKGQEIKSISRQRGNVWEVLKFDDKPTKGGLW